MLTQSISQQCVCCLCRETDSFAIGVQWLFRIERNSVDHGPMPTVRDECRTSIPCYPFHLLWQPLEQVVRVDWTMSCLKLRRVQRRVEK
jgi:hypothetical protein